MSVQIINGDALLELRKLASGSVNCCVTSPPYFGLRDYGVAGQIGMEETPTAFLAALVTVFSEVKRVLRDDGTIWVNMGDSYAGSWGAQSRRDSSTNEQSVSRNQISNHPKHASCTGSIKEAGIKAKDLMGIPWRLAFALQADGWYLRSDIIWHKPNPMPESVTDRPTKAHEYIFLLSKQEKYYYDAAAIFEPVSAGTHARLSQNVQAQIGSERANGGAKTNCNMKAVGRTVGVGHNARPRKAVPNGSGIKNNTSFDEAMAIMPEFRNKRTVWTVPTAAVKDAHFATFPPALIRPCILAGCPRGGVVLDPFGGIGTTGEVAEQEGRNSILIELNPAYVEIAKRRTAQTGLLHEA